MAPKLLELAFFDTQNVVQFGLTTLQLRLFDPQISLQASALDSFGVAGPPIARILHSAVASHLSAYAHKCRAFTCLNFKEPSRA